MRRLLRAAARPLQRSVRANVVKALVFDGFRAGLGFRVWGLQFEA